jgi:hypothetical protein
LTGACGVGRPVASETPSVVPSPLSALTWKRSRRARSAAVTRYDIAAAPAIGAQPAPAASQRSHWYVSESRPVFDAHSPSVPVSRIPFAYEPVICGRRMLTGSASLSGSVARDVTVTTAWPLSARTS